jgi:hypothetical protein
VKAVWWFIAVLTVVLAAAALWLLARDGHGAPSPAVRGALALAVLGDSDSTGYQNRVDFSGRTLPPEALAGGAFHGITLQWHEALARLRPQDIDLGPHGTWGLPRWQSLTRLRDALGQPWRGPLKQDHRHNFAWPSGCSSLTTEPWAQAPRLAQLMRQSPERWQQGVVVIRIGVNDFGKDDTLDRLARDPADAASRQLMDACAAQYATAMRLLRQDQPTLRFVLVGIANNAHWVPYLDRWASAAEQANIAAGLQHFDNALRKLADADANVAFFDDQAWFEARWGSRDAQGQPAYRTPAIAPGWTVSNTRGDDPRHAVLGNQHAGLAWNLWWAQSLVALMRDRFAMKVPAISDEELARFATALRAGAESQAK